MAIKAQVTIFIIIAIVLVAGIVGYFLLKDRIFVQTFPAKFQPIEQRFLDCVRERADIGKNMLLDNAGWIYLPEFVPGNQYAPFSSQLDFQGRGIPYWYYLSSGNSIKEQVPSKLVMQQQLEKYIENNFDCDFSDFISQGYIINYTELKASVKINSLDVQVQVNSELYVERENDSARQISHSIQIDTKLGKLYDEAFTIYDAEKKQMFLEDYGIDVLRLYAPVDGVEISCAPKTWIPENIVSDIQNALETNVASIKTNSNYYQISSDQKYFVQNIATDDAVNFIYSKSWPGRVEVWPSDGSVMIAEPVGNQQGLGVMGFCYVPYHFVYDLMYPVLVQVYDSQEIFQFPISVIIQKNKPREALQGTAIDDTSVDFCKYKNTDVSVHTYDSMLNPVAADISFKCFDSSCDIGKSEVIDDQAVLDGKFPQCVNGFIVARAKGFAEKTQMFSSNNPGSVDVIMDKLYNVSLHLDIDGKEPESAIIYFSGEYPATVLWPQQKDVQLTEGPYNVSVYVYRNSSLIFPASSQEKCVDTPKSGLLGIFGGTDQQCFTINQPQQQITNVLAGGGKTQDYFTQDRLEGGLKISAPELPVPTSLDQLAKNYELFDSQVITISNG